MITFTAGTTRNCEGTQRRDFLKIGALSGLGLALPQLLAAKAASDDKKRPDVNCILIWTRGGTSHHDTFDPKPLAGPEIRGDFQVIDTAIPGVQFTEVCPRFATEAKRFGLLRGWNPNNAGHSIAEAICMSGRDFNPAVPYPCYGSIMSHHKGFKTKLPPFVQIGDYVSRDSGGGTAGYLGSEHNPFELFNDPNATPFVVRDVTPPKGTDGTRIDRRRQMLAAIDAAQRKADLQPADFESLDKHHQAAFNMVTSPETKKAFDIESEDPKLRDQYGRNRFGQGCLLARRLIEGGVRFVTVSDDGWDTHGNNFAGLRNAMPRIDQGVPRLLIDLEERGLLETTLVVWLTDFGRTPKINAASGRDHWATAGFAIMAGAGVPGGSVLGQTDAEGGRPTADEYFTKDIAATIYTKLGVPLDLLTHTADGRPVILNEGRVIKEWM